MIRSQETDPTQISSTRCWRGRSARDSVAVHFGHRSAQRAGQRRPSYRLGQPGPARRRPICRALLDGVDLVWSGSSAATGCGRRASTRCGPAIVPVVVLGGEQTPDAELMGRSTVPTGIAAQAHAYLAQGGPDNLRELHALPVRHGAADRPRLRAAGRAADLGACWPAQRRPAPTARSIAILYYRAHHLSGNTAFVQTLAAAVEDAGGRGAADLLRVAAQRRRRTCWTPWRPPTRCWSPCWRPAAPDRPAAAAGGDDDAWDVAALAALDIPILQALCLTSSRADVGGQRRGAVPAGRREPGRGARVRRPDHHGAVLVQGDRRRRPAALRRRPRALPPGWPGSRSGTPGCGTSRPRERRIALVLSAYPTKHARVGNAVGLDTPASAVRLLRAMRERGLRPRPARRPGALPGLVPDRSTATTGTRPATR